MQHKDVGTGSNHIIHNYQFADIAQRDQFVGTEADLLKVCLVLTPFSYYTLSSINPIKWEQFGGGTSGSGNSEVIEVIRSNENPTITTNPSEKGILWVNYATNEIFVCIDNIYDDNIWKGNQKTIISKNKIYQYDILNDYTCIAFFQLDDNLIDMGGAFQISTYNADYEIGNMGKCLKMNYTNSKVELYSKMKSISFWAYFPDTLPNSSNNLLDCRGYGINCYINVDINFSIYSLVGATIYQDGVQITGGKLIKNQWVHIAINFNGEPSGVKLLNSYTQVNGMTNTKIDHIRCFNRVLNTQDITKLMAEV